MLGWWWPHEINKTIWASELCLYVAKHSTYPKCESQFLSKAKNLIVKVNGNSQVHYISLDCKCHLGV